MPATEILLYREANGSVPVLDWLNELRRKNRRAFEKCLFLISLLEEWGYELRRPSADLLRDGVYELRTEVGGVNYRVLYGFVGKDIAVLAHGLTKTSKVPAQEIDLAAARLSRFLRSPERHIARLETDDEKD